MAFRPHDTDGGGEIVAEINITPLTDIFLVLLIIFMVTSSVMSNQGVEVKLPSASPAAAESQPDGTIITLLPDGGLKVNSVAIRAGDYGALEASLRTALSQAKSKLVILEGDRRALLGNAIEVMDHAKRAGAESFAVATSPETK